MPASLTTFMCCSYGEQDVPVVELFKAHLRAEGVEPIVEKERYSVGTSVPQDIRESMETCDFVTFTITAPGPSTWLQNEFGIAFGLNKTTVIFVEEGAELGESLPKTMGLQLARFRRVESGNIERQVREVMKSVREKLERQRSVPLLTISMRPVQELQIVNLFAVSEENPQRDQRMAEVLSQETGSLRLLARTGRSYLHVEGKNWRQRFGGRFVGVERRLDSGVPMTVILENPYDENGRLRLQADGETQPWTDMPWARLEQLVDRYERNLEVSFTSVPMFCSLFFTDQSVFYDPYHFGTVAQGQPTKNNFLVIEFDNRQSRAGKSSYATLERHFEFVRQSGMTMSFEEFREKYCDVLPT